MELWYDRPARSWNEALPLGNGSLGAMVHGGLGRECLDLNIDTLWSGYPRHSPNPAARAGLVACREALGRSDWHGADAACRDLLGAYTESYLPLGSLRIDFLHGDVAAGCRRSLDLSRGFHGQTLRIGADTYRRECFISYPDQVLVLRLVSSRPGGLDCDFRLEGSLEWEALEPTRLRQGSVRSMIRGRAPDRASPSYCDATQPLRWLPEDESRALRWACGMIITSIDGSLEIRRQGVCARGATSVELVLAAATTWRGHGVMPGTDVAPALATVEGRLAHAADLGWTRLLERHLEDWCALWNRVDLQLGPPMSASIPTDLRIARHGAEDKDLVATLFHYGRYLLMASSRPGSLPANLQGIWNREVRPPWSSNYTININTQMNYWPAWSCNLAECAAPLLDFLPVLASRGKLVATDFFRCDGWTASHNTDAWAHASPVGGFGEGDPVWAFWPLGGIWLAMAMWEEWRHRGNQDFLSRELWPVFEGAARFALDWLQPDPATGLLGTAPSTSPEHKFRLPDGSLAAVGVSSTIDLCLIAELFDRCLEAGRLLGSDGAFLERVADARARLAQPTPDLEGEVAEWMHGLPGEDPHHRHLSHLYGVFPGTNWGPRTTPALWEAARKSLDRRGPLGTGWSLAWKVCLRARFGQGDLALDQIRMLLKPAVAAQPDGGLEERGGVYLNLLDACPPFQIDGNFGVTAGIALMLVQVDHEGITLLPALPGDWDQGAVRGLCLPGGSEVDIRWEKGFLAEAVFRSRTDVRLVVRCPRARLEKGKEPVRILDIGAGAATVIGPDLSPRTRSNP